MSGHYLIYVRRSYVKTGAPDISDEAQVAAALTMLPAGASHEVIADSGGHHSGRTGDRDGYRTLLTRIEDGGIAGLAVYDLSRLARNAHLMLGLHRALERAGIPLLIANMPHTKWDTATGRFMLGQLALAAQFQADLDSERMTGLMRTLFEDGRHRGQDPFGYRSVRDEGRRMLVPSDDAPVVRDVFARLAHQSFGEIARDYGWTPSRVKDIYRRARVYLGYVVEKRGRDERPGRHEPLIDEETYRAAVQGVIERSHGRVRRPPKRRTYILAGVLFCGACKHRLIGQTQMSRNQEWRYYICRHCPAKAVYGEQAETDVLRRLASLRLPAHVIEEARDELRRRLAVPVGGLVDRQRARLERRLANLQKQHEWGDLSDEAYRRKAVAVRTELAALPDDDKIILFDRWRGVIESMADNLAVASPEQQADLVRMLVERIESRGREVGEIIPVPPARPFFRITGAPPDGLEHPLDMRLDWYEAAVQ